MLPRLYLRGLSTGDFREALPVLLGEDAAGLSPTNIARLTATWDEDYQAFRRRDLSECDYIYVWVDGIHFNASPFGVVEALDAANGELRWRYRHERESDDLAGIVTTRNLASTTTRSIRRRSTRTSSPSTRGPATSGGTSPAPTTGWGSATRRGPSSSRGRWWRARTGASGTTRPRSAHDPMPTHRPIDCLHEPCSRKTLMYI